MMISYLWTVLFSADNIIFQIFLVLIFPIEVLNTFFVWFSAIFCVSYDGRYMINVCWTWKLLNYDVVDALDAKNNSTEESPKNPSPSFNSTKLSNETNNKNDNGKSDDNKQVTMDSSMEGSGFEGFNKSPFLKDDGQDINNVNTTEEKLVSDGGFYI